MELHHQYFACTLSQQQSCPWRLEHAFVGCNDAVWECHALEVCGVICMLRTLCCWPKVLAGLRNAEAPGPSVQRSSSQVGTNLVGNWGTPGQGSSTDVYPPSPNLVDMGTGEARQSCSPSVQSSSPQGMPSIVTLEGSTEVLDKAASLPCSPAAAPQQTHQHAQAALGTAPLRGRNASFGQSSTTADQQLTTDSERQYDSKSLSDDCARPLSDQSLNSSGSASAEVTKISKKRAAEVSSAEPAAKLLTVAEGGNGVARRRSSGGQGTTTVGGAFGVEGEATADVDGDGDSILADGGESIDQGRRRTVRLRKKSSTTAVQVQGDHGSEDIEVVARY